MRKVRGDALCAVVAVVMLSGAGCGPQISTQVRWESKAFDANEFRQEKDGVIVENREMKEIPPALVAQAQACTPEGALVVDQSGAPVMEKVALTPAGTTWYQIAITNKTGHVMRLNSAVIRLFDPANNESEPVAKDDLGSLFLAGRPCPSSQSIAGQIRLIKLIDRNTEILPDTTITGYLAFKPTAPRMPGIWKVALYEIPTVTDEAGKVTKTTRFEVRTVMKKWVDTYQQDGMFGERQLKESKEAAE